MIKTVHKELPYSSIKSWINIKPVSMAECKQKARLEWSNSFFFFFFLAILSKRCDTQKTLVVGCTLCDLHFRLCHMWCTQEYQSSYQLTIFVNYFLNYKCSRAVRISLKQNFSVTKSIT